MVDLEALTGHTPGPWILGKGPAFGKTVFNGPLSKNTPAQVTGADIVGGRQICEADDDCGDRPAAEVKANARLIAAAPDLITEVRALRADQCATRTRVAELERLGTELADSTPGSLAQHHARGAWRKAVSMSRELRQATEMTLEELYGQCFAESTVCDEIFARMRILAKALKAVEWGATRSRACELCRRYCSDGHAPDCIIGKILRP